MSTGCRRGAAAVRQAADRLVARLVRELADAKAVNFRLQQELTGSAVGCAADLAEVARREAIARPALLARVRGTREPGARRLKRNVAWHADECPDESAPLAEWRSAQKGPRLGGAVGDTVEQEVKAIPAVRQLLLGAVGVLPRRLPHGLVWRAAPLETFLAFEAGKQCIELDAGTAAFAPAAAPCVDARAGAGGPRGVGCRCTCGTVAFSSVPVGARPVRGCHREAAAPPSECDSAAGSVFFSSGEESEVDECPGDQLVFEECGSAEATSEGFDLEVTVPVAAVLPTDDDQMSVDRVGEPIAELGAASEVDVEDFLAETLAASDPVAGVHMGVVVCELERLGLDIEIVAAYLASPRFAEVFYVEGESLFRVDGADAPSAPPVRPSGARAGERGP
ncbi:unnamed protein product [Prorocentrum cordatum]|uniref:Uncharacterized protein n=1 Tax=Prorocentrum cordatum TaxID=2364126 RepID=A0ABN9U279_9DINO|nr:unnamed protein product [Polarella glacialis]